MAEDPKDEASVIIKLGKIIYSLRQRAGISRGKLARFSRLSEGTIKVVESGRHRARPRTLIRILNALRVPDDESAALLKLLDERNPQHIQLELSVSPLTHNGDEVGEVVTVRFFLLPTFKQR